MCEMKTAWRRCFCWKSYLVAWQTPSHTHTCTPITIPRSWWERGVAALKVNARIWTKQQFKGAFEQSVTSLLCTTTSNISVIGPQCMYCGPILALTNQTKDNKLTQKEAPTINKSISLQAETDAPYYTAACTYTVRIHLSPAAERQDTNRNRFHFLYSPTLLQYTCESMLPAHNKGKSNVTHPWGSSYGTQAPHSLSCCLEPDTVMGSH